MTMPSAPFLTALQFSPPAWAQLDLRTLAREFDTVLSSLEPWLLGAYYGAMLVLSLYALHRLQLLYLLYRARPTNDALTSELQPVFESALPPVTVQLPIYNERAVAQRLLDAVANLDYPSQLLQIQVLDDSTDETSAVLTARVAHWQQLGLSVQHHRRGNRKGYKAGALAAGLSNATGELIAIFDADFVPPPDFLRRVVPYFTQPDLGMVQARWDHLNRDQSLLTRIQAVLLDGHFLVEHAARSGTKRLFNFNGTAGVWRKQAIEDGGGWQHDTLTEDLDLSYRSQLAGWRFVFLPHVGVPSELPDSLSSYRSQQRRWTRGSAQTFRKLGKTILRSSLTVAQRVEGMAHLSANLGYPLTVLVAVLLPAVVYLRHLGAEPGLLWLDLGLLFCGALSLCAFYLEATRRRGHSLLVALVLMPALFALCMGLAWHNSKAAIGGLFIEGGTFDRTPKAGSTLDRTYSTARAFPWGETIIALYLGCATMFLAASGVYLGLPFLLLFLLGFSSAAATLWRRGSAPERTARTTSGAGVLQPEPGFDPEP